VQFTEQIINNRFAVVILELIINEKPVCIDIKLRYPNCIKLNGRLRPSLDTSYGIAFWTVLYSFALLLMIPALFFGNIVPTTDDTSNNEPHTVEASKAAAAFFTVDLPDDPNCTGNDTFLWENNIRILNTGWVDADVRFIDSSNGYLSYLNLTIPTIFKMAPRLHNGKMH